MMILMDALGQRRQENCVSWQRKGSIHFSLSQPVAQRIPGKGKFPLHGMLSSKEILVLKYEIIKKERALKWNHNTADDIRLSMLL